MTPQGVFTNIKSFTNTTGAVPGRLPVGGLVQGTNGHLYGMTSAGGTTDYGTVFKLDEANNFTSLITFTYTSTPSMGRGPDNTLILAADGNFYGTTESGGTGIRGTVFRMTPAGVHTVLANFSSPGPYNPTGKLTQVPNGDFYGMTEYGNNFNGAIFKMTSDNTVTTVVLFTGTAGAKLGINPNGRLIYHDGFLYGVTSRGGAGNHGTIFKTDLDGNLTTLVVFTNTGATNRGATPLGGLTLGPDGNFYGMTQRGGASDMGTVFQMTPAGVLTTLLEFVGSGPGPTSGNGPQNVHFIPDADGNLYGVTTQGGLSSQGTVIRLVFGDAAPVIELTGNGTSIPHEDTTPSMEDNTDFGQLDVAAPGTSYTFTLTNSGGADLTFTSSAVSVTGTDFTVTAQPGSTVAPEGSTTFEITFDPATPGVKDATVSIASNDAPPLPTPLPSQARA